MSRFCLSIVLGLALLAAVPAEAQSPPFEATTSVPPNIPPQGTGQLPAINPADGGAQVHIVNQTVPTSGPTPAAIYTAQVKILVTGTAVQLPAHAFVNGFVVTLKSSNAGYDCIGGTSSVSTASDGTGNGSCKPPGSAWAFAVANSSAVWINGAAGDVAFVDGN